MEEVRSYDDCVNAIIEQAKHWYKIGKIYKYNKENVWEAAEVALTEKELYVHCGCNDAVIRALQSL